MAYLKHNKSLIASQGLKKVFYKKNNEKFELIFAGDTSFGENYQERIKQKGGESILDQYGYAYGLENFKQAMTNSDFVVLNLETPITDCKHSPFEGEKDYIHWTDKEKAPKTLLDHNVSLVSLANNHTFDYGIEAYNQTLSILKEHNLPVIGCGNNIDEANAPFICEINFENKKKTIAIIAAFEDLNSYRKKYKVYADIEKPGLMPLDITLIADRVEKIKALDPNCLVILFPHWGDNYQWCNDKQLNLTNSLFARGVDLIIGHGAHMIQEFEKRDHNLVLYSIGNFMFHSPGRYKKMQAPPYSGIVSLSLQIVNDEIDIQLKLYPIVSDNKITNYQPRFVTKSELNNLCEVLLNSEPNDSSKKIIVNSGNLLTAKQDEMGYYFQIPFIENHLVKQDNKQKWIGLLFHNKHEIKMQNDKFNMILHRASALAPELAKYNYKLICYSPTDVNQEDKTVNGYILENNKFKRTCVNIPNVTYDFYIGEDDLNIYYKFRLWALEHKYKTYPTKTIGRVAQDKFLTAQLLSKFNAAMVPYTEVFEGNILQLQTYFSKGNTIFIKPRYGARGDKILVVKSENNAFIVEYYTDTRKKHISSFSTLPECLTYINHTINSIKYIIQEAVDTILCEGSVFDIRALVFNEGEEWHFLGEGRIGIESSKLSNNGGTDIPLELLERIFSKEKALSIMEKIKDITINLTIFLSREYQELINELAFDVMIDKSENIYFAEINTKPGLAGLAKYSDFFNMTDYENNFYEKLSLKHGSLLAKSLIHRDS